MVEISLHILDIVQNSIKAEATEIGISVVEDTEKNILTVEITDNGNGMSEEFVKNVTDPFVTMRKTRKVGHERHKRSCPTFFIISKNLYFDLVFYTTLLVLDHYYISFPPLQKQMAERTLSNYLYNKKR